MDTYNDVCEAVLTYCSTKTSSNAFKLWLSEITVTGFENNTFTLFLPSSFKRKIVIDTYDSLLNEAFENVMGFSVNLNYDCPEEQKSIFDSARSDHERDLETARNVKNNIEKSDNLPIEQFTFDTFIEGPSNRFAYRAAMAVADNPGGTAKNEISYNNYNPLFIYGKSGLGKTHILNAICYQIRKNYPAMRILYVRSEDFVNEFIAALGNKTVDEFHDKFRNIDVLLVDDIQLIGGKDRTEEEFFHTFNSLVENGKQIVLTSDRPPKEIKSLTDRLCTRFEQGLLADIQSPEYETRCAIIKRKAELLNFEIPNFVVEYIAEKIKTNIRQLEGTTKKIYAMSQLSGTIPSIPLAQRVIKDVTTDTQPVPVTIQKIVEEVSRTEGVSVEDLYSKKRRANIVNARKIAIYMIREITNCSYETIGDNFGLNHSTIIYNINQLIESMEKNSKLARKIEDMINNIKEDNY